MPVRKTAKKLASNVELNPVEEENSKENKSSLKKENPKRREPGVGTFTDERVLFEVDDNTRDLVSSGTFGTKISGDNYQLSLLEGLYLLEKSRLVVLDGKKKAMTFDQFLKRAKKVEPNFWIRYSVFRDLRARGYIVKTALKFGADFRVYDRGIKPGEDHARWVVYPVHEGEMLTWHDFAAKNRVAHSTKKRLLIGIVDDEADVTYYEIKWIRP